MFANATRTARRRRPSATFRPTAVPSVSLRMTARRRRFARSPRLPVCGRARVIRTVPLRFPCASKKRVRVACAPTPASARRRRRTAIRRRVGAWSASKTPIARPTWTWICATTMANASGALRTVTATRVRMSAVSFSATAVSSARERCHRARSTSPFVTKSSASVSNARSTRTVRRTSPSAETPNAGNARRAERQVSFEAASVSVPKRSGNTLATTSSHGAE